MDFCMQELRFFSGGVNLIDFENFTISLFKRKLVEFKNFLSIKVPLNFVTWRSFFIHEIVSLMKSFFVTRSFPVMKSYFFHEIYILLDLCSRNKQTPYLILPSISLNLVKFNSYLQFFLIQQIINVDRRHRQFKKKKKILLPCPVNHHINFLKANPTCLSYTFLRANFLHPVIIFSISRRFC